MINTLNIEIWGRKFTLEVEYKCYPGESVAQNQIYAVVRFSRNPQWIDKAKKNVEEYCREDVENDDENTKKDNIFSYIKPIDIFVKRDNDNHRIAIMCKYRYDPEHGMAIVFDNNGKITVGAQDIIL